MTRLLVFADDLVELVDNALFKVVQGIEYTRLFNGIRCPVCVYVLEQLKVALLVVYFAQPVN